ncbi:MAG: enoyl-CoA hydratase-related protein [Microlunatus sp.]|nr:enoyl-CoA hydratase-related protein [Microlunatus sp.]
MDRTVLPGGVELIFGEDRRIAQVWLVRPEVRNAQTVATWASLARAAELIADRPDVSAVLLRGAGTDFSAGLDLRMLTGTAPDGEGDLASLLEGDDDAVERAIAAFQQGFTCWRGLGAVVVAVVTGRAIGAGFQLALGADLRVLSADAMLVMGEATLGLVPDLGGTRRLVELVGYPRALEICATARPVDAEHARRLGLADLVVDDADFETAVEAYLAGFLAVDPATSRAVKSLMKDASSRTGDEQLAAERAAQIALLRRLRLS